MTTVAVASGLVATCAVTGWLWVGRPAVDWLLGRWEASWLPGTWEDR